MTKAVAIKEETAVVVTEIIDTSILAQDMMENSGLENVGMEDIAVPRLRILQSNSPQIVKEAERIEGARIGDFLNTATNEVYKKGTFQLVPCCFQKSWTEWGVREAKGGYFGVTLTDELSKTTTKDAKNRDILPNGHQLVQTATHFCVLIREDGSYLRVVLDLVSTQLKKSRKWLSTMMALQLELKGKKFTPPSYAYGYPVTSVEESNDHGTWAGVAIGSPTLLQDANLYEYAKGFAKDVKSGSVKLAEPSDDVVAEPVGDVTPSDKF